MNKDSTQYTFFFALIICVVCSFMLALVSEGLRPRKELNQALDVKKNILKAVGLRDPLSAKATEDEVLKVYNSKISEMVIDAQGNVIEGLAPGDVKEGEEAYPLYIYKENGETLSFAFPIVGKGLWSTLYGYLAIEPDAKTVRGITYYKHGETPGLGAEIDADWFQDNFKGKKIWDDVQNQLKPVSVIKGKVEDKITGKETDYYVDGISGATMTANGVTEMIDRELKKYEPFLSKARGG